MNSRIILVATLTATLVLSGCASTNASRADPFEGMNRRIFAFNDAVDATVLKPVAQGYASVTPDFVQAGISNLFTNVGDVAGAVNSLLQGKPIEAVSNAGRFAINSTLGIFGLFDVATPMGLDKHDEDFGQTLGTWGVASGPYVVIPFMGPSTVRDATGRGADSFLGWSHQVDHIPTRNVAYAIEVIELRANLLGAGKTLEEAALDKYQFLRDAYLQRRLRMVHDGKVPQSKMDQLEEDLEPPRTPARTEPPAKADLPEKK